MKKILIAGLLFGSFAGIRAQESATLNQQEKEAILYMREEEKLARDVYHFLYEKWSTNPFGNIRQSEQTHMDRVEALIRTYRLDDPVAKSNDKKGHFQNEFLQKQYDELTASGSLSLRGALQAGAKIEELDIADLDVRIKQTTRADINATFEYLRMASENHLRAFVRRLERMGVTYTPVILEKAVFNKIITSAGNQRGYGRNGWN